jgi:putative FmdB family regulatory protein
MPTYEYKCDNCGHTFDEFQSFKDEPLKDCPQCAEPKLRRLFGTGAAILFKGSGFYETDYRSESYKKAAKADEAPAAKSGSTDSAAKDSSSKGSSSKDSSSKGSSSAASNGTTKDTKSPKPSS